MSGEFLINTANGRMTIKNGARTVFTTDGTLVSLLPESYDYNGTVNVVFPDPAKSVAYWFNYYSNVDTVEEPGKPTKYQWFDQNSCAAYVSAIPQEFSGTQILKAVPAGCDFVFGTVNVRRTVNPATTWNGSTIRKQVIENVAIPFSGSLLLESEVCLVRAASIIISGGNLIIHRQQSIGPIPNGFDILTRIVQKDSGSSNIYGDRVFGTQWSALSTPGIPVFTKTGSPQQKTDGRAGISGPRPPSRPGTALQPNSSNKCTIADTTDYASTWQFTISAAFGNRTKG